MTGESLISFGAPDWGSTQVEFGGRSYTTQCEQSLERARSTPLTVSESGATGLKKQSSTLTASVRSQCEVAIPCSSRCSIDSKISEARLGLQNHGCHPTWAGIA
jgi:hypothetical protein